MPEYERLRARDVHDRAFRLLLRLYPRQIREELGDAMVEFFRDRIADSRRAHGSLGVLEAWGAAIADALRHAPLARFEAIRRALTHLTSPPLRAVVDARRKDRMLSSISQDIRHAMRGMRRSPAFTLLVIATLALGMGANVAIFSIVNGILLKPLPFEEPDQLVRIDQADPYWNISEPEFADYRRDAHTLSGVAAYAFGSASFTGQGEEAERVDGARVSDGFFQVLRVSALLGRTFQPDEERAGAAPVVVLSYGLWQRRYGGDKTIVGRDILVNGSVRTVVGVMPPSFRFPREDTGVWTPIGFQYDSLWTRNNHYLQAIGRVAPGVEVAQASAELRTLTRNWTKDYPDVYFPGKPLTVSAIPLTLAVVGNARPYLMALLGAVGFVLLIACVNVANLLLVRGESRRKELAVRTALGASRTRLVRQGLTESILFSLAGALAGLAIAKLGVRALLLLAPAELPRLNEVAIDPTVLWFAVAIAAFTSLAFGVAPAWMAAREDTSETLKEGGRTSTSASRGAGRTRRRLVSAEIALTVITLCGAGLMVRSLGRLQAVDLGFQSDHVLTMRISTSPVVGASTEEQQNDRASLFYDQLLARVRAAPRVTAVGAVEDLPVADGESNWSILIDGAPMTSVAQAPAAMPQKVTADYFKVMRIPLVKGRTFTDQDRADAPLVAVINETMARKEWPDRDPLGGTIRMLSPTAPMATVVGIVKDVRSTGFTGKSPPTMYFPQQQAGRSAYYVPSLMSLVVRTPGDPSALTAVIRGIVRDLDPNAPVWRVATMDRLVADSVGARRFSTLLLAGFGALALLLAAIGIYGVISSTVAQRRYEIGVRMALGARRQDVVVMVLREGLRTAALGAAIGLVGAVASAYALRAVFYDVKAWDPLTLAGTILVLMLAALLASWLPAMRASTVHPMSALRVD
ncbi:MAG: ABC transporter permease [Gemmatimonadaceae bacterium]